METIFLTLRKILIGFAITTFAFAFVYVPQDWNKVKNAEALGNVATETTQILNNIELAAINVWDSITSAATTVTSFMTTSLNMKEYVLDGIAWKIAKFMVSSMVSSLINWINSGFKGSPAFVQDVKRYLVDAADKEVGEYIQNLGGPGSFICSPFQLNIQVALAVKYSRVRENDLPETGKCTLTGVVDNIEDFLSGSPGSFSQGGWNDWIDITSSPEKYTPYGAYLTAERIAEAKIQNAKGEALKIADFGSGFLSGKICDIIEGPNGKKEDCIISKPGKIIQEALSFNLDTSRESLISADEIDEVIAALMGQLANKALNGAAGLLGLSGGTGYTYSGFSAGSYVDQMVADQAAAGGTDILSTMKDSLQIQKDYNALAQSYYPKLKASTKAIARTEEKNALEIINQSAVNIASSTVIIAEYEDSDTTPERKAELISEFFKQPLYNRSQLEASRTAWDKIVN